MLGESDVFLDDTIRGRLYLFRSFVDGHIVKFGCIESLRPSARENNIEIVPRTTVACRRELEARFRFERGVR